MGKKYKKVEWKNLPQEEPILASSLINRIESDICVTSDVTMNAGELRFTVKAVPNGELKKLQCECCGAPLNRETLTCEYCGTQYRR